MSAVHEAVGSVVLSSDVDLADGDALGEFLGELRRKLRDSGRGKVRIVVTFDS